MNFGIFLSTEAAKFHKNIEKEDKNRIIEKLMLFENGPFCLPYKKIKERENTYNIGQIVKLLESRNVIS